MIVLGADTHKRSHTVAAVSAATGEVVGEQTVQVGARGFAALVVWARRLDSERVWALEDCRHVSGSFERFLIERGERVLRVHSKHGECPDGWEAAALRRHNGRDEPMLPGRAGNTREPASCPGPTRVQGVGWRPTGRQSWPRSTMSAVSREP